MVEGLRACGVEADELPDGLIVQGAKTIRGGAEIRTGGDHRIAMSFLVMGLASGKPVGIDDGAFIATSFPGFVPMLQGLGADLT